MSSSSSAVVKPTVVFVPGAFHTPSHFQDFSEFLQKSSYPSVAVALPSIGGQASTANLDDDVGAIRSVLTQLVEDEKDVILVVHSYGGVPGCQTVRGLEKSTLMKEGQKGGVVQVLFIAAFVLEQGQCVVEVLGGGLPPWARAEGNVLHPANTSPVFYNQLSDQDAEHFTSLLRPQSAVPSTMPIKDVCYDLDVPITYLLCNGDTMLSIFEEMVGKVKRPSWKLQNIDGDHCPFLSNKEGLLRVIETSH